MIDGFEKSDPMACRIYEKIKESKLMNVRHVKLTTQDQERHLHRDCFKVFLQSLSQVTEMTMLGAAAIMCANEAQDGA